MSFEETDPYSPPTSDLSTPESGIFLRSDLVPLWIKIFGWLFLIMAVLFVPFLLWATIVEENVFFELFGFAYSGTARSIYAFAIVGLYAFMGATAYGLLFRKDWGVDGCMANGYVGVALCLISMILSGGTNIRLEPIIQFFYLRRLHGIRQSWANAKS